MKQIDKKLSDKQKEVIRLMRDNWELGKDRYGDNLTSLSKDNSQTQFVNKNTFNSLYKKCIISFEYRKSIHTSVYSLTELGKTIQL